jgi:hypothetical protein
MTDIDYTERAKEINMCPGMLRWLDFCVWYIIIMLDHHSVVIKPIKVKVLKRRFF